MLPSSLTWTQSDFSTFLDAAPDAMLVIDDQGRIVLANSQTEQIFGYSCLELVGQMVEILVPERYRHQHPRQRESFVADPQVRPMDVGLELFGLRKDGGEFPAEISLSPLTARAGSFVISAIRDVSERKLAEAQIRELNDELERTLLRRRTLDATSRLAAVVEGSEDAIIAYGLHGVITDWNQAATRLFGYSGEEVVGQHVSILAAPSRANEYTEILKAVAAGSRIQRIEGLRRRKGGGLVDVAYTVSPIAGEDGRIIGASSIVRDVSNRKRMEEALRRSEERFRLVAQATKDVIWDWDMGSGRIWRSASFWEHFGYPPKDVEPGFSGWKDLLHPEDRGRVLDSFQTALSRQSSSFENEYRFRRGDGTYAVVLDRGIIVYDETGKPTRAIGAATDLSDRRELEEQFRQAQKMEAVGQLAGGIAHDFNNLLMVISSYTEMAQGQHLPEDKAHKQLAEVLKAADKAASLTHQLLAFSRKQVLSPRVIDLNAMVEDSLKMIQRLIGEDIELNVSLSEALWAVKADPGQIVQVLMNLCVNARDAMRNGGELRIETKNVSVDMEAATKLPALVPGDYAALMVSDNGTGMTDEVRAHIFDPFFTTKESGKGTGLGLSTVYGIVKQSGGYIWVESELARGTTFSLYFPAVKSPLTTTVAPAISQSKGQGETILLAEDEDALREAISAYLNVHGYTVLEAANGVEALRLATLHAGSIQLLLTDVILPKKSGAELAREVSILSPDVATLYMSGYTDRNLVDYDPGEFNSEIPTETVCASNSLGEIRRDDRCSAWLTLGNTHVTSIQMADPAVHLFPGRLPMHQDDG
jgi:two-component system, cell cycle sensor histidine kinase and response regulator CckA